MDILLQIVGFVALAYLAIKFAPNILNAVFKLSVVAIGIVFMLFLVCLVMSNWSIIHV
jgi:hypothetical protein|tara:strand:+ start:678 stop:851 length:174 start_codon:yes stop_codon:yes gene_type:complete